MHEDYPRYHERLQALTAKLAKELRGPMSAFAQLNGAATAAGVLSTKTKQLIALGIGITVRCDGCIAYHVHDALRAGATKQEILETIGIAILMGGGPAVVYGCEALEALDQFEAAGLPSQNRE
ncbi:carboxymuconolactone decarboxylase family protein [Desulforhabdus sp. TSK]|uniref:carboxymuconolactone decarboxylase family protein n=1 Tax=Desulforhabdus sp. TSK TaxID=2925014 RepID=UPI001FC7DC0A|nr:carboxymuconolactone decarboxylase family protein [Desulforhabdus sp. TSK]GKT07771.1 alkyl hydroperoxide reductase AhpD [Desulforhabdus sp. TSK]